MELSWRNVNQHLFVRGVQGCKCTTNRLVLERPQISISSRWPQRPPKVRQATASASSTPEWLLTARALLNEETASKLRTLAAGPRTWSHPLQARPSR